MISSILLFAALAADPTASPEKPAETAPPAATSEPRGEASTDEAEARAPELELVIPERMIEEFLAAAAPYDRRVTRDVVLLGFAKKVQVDIHLTNPRVKVTPQGIHVTMDYELKGPGGITSRGRATPRLELRALSDKGLIEGRLTGAKLSATGGIEVPVDDLMEPVRFPAGAGGPLQVGEQKVIAHGRAREVVLEKGRVRVLGDWEFKKPGAVASDAAQ